MTTGERLALFLPNMRGGGAERVALALAHGFLDRGHQVDLVLAQKVGELLPLLRPEVKIVDLAASRLRDTLRPLTRYLRERRPAALQALMYPLPVIALAARRLAGSSTRIVAAEHTTLSRAPRGVLARHAAPRLIRTAYRHADAITIVSAGAADDLARYAELPLGGIEVIHNPLLLPPHPLSSEKMHAVWPTRAGRLLAVGTLKPEKNIPLLLYALKRLTTRREASLVLVGEGSERKRLEAIVREQGLGEHVVFAGFDLDPWPYYAAADTFVLPSNYEGLGNVIVEAMYAGVPVVSTDCPHGPRELLDGGTFGRLVPCGRADLLADAIEATLDAPLVAGPVARARAEELAGARPIDRYLEVMLG